MINRNTMNRGKSLNRRNFLKLNTAGVAGLATAPFFLNREAPSYLPLFKKPKKIIYRTLGKTGLKLPVVSMGVMRADNPNLVKAALSAGMVHLDTAHGYQNGRNEQMLGELLQDYPRESFVISTKIPDGEDMTVEKFLEKLDISLERLKMDHVDILYLHSTRDRETTLAPLYLKALEKAKSLGKTRFVGVSTHSNEAEVLKAAADSNFYDIVLTAYNYRQENMTGIKEAIAYAADAGVGIIGMKTMAGGFLDKEKTKPVNAKAALKWVLQDKNVHTTIPGFVNYEELKVNVDVMSDIKLTREEKSELDASNQLAGLFCVGCEKCLDSCRQGLPVPDIMRSYMYTYGYGDARLGQSVLQDLKLQDNPCSDCDECTVNCTRGFNVAEKINDIIRLKGVPGEFLA